MVEKAGRKWFDLTPEDEKNGRTEESIIAKCQEIWSLDGTDDEASYYAEVSPSSISRYLTAHPDVDELRTRMKNRPVLKARRAVIKGLDNYSNAMDYLKRKRKKEFGDNIDITTEGKALILPQELINKNNINAATQPTEKNSNIDEKI